MLPRFLRPTELHRTSSAYRLPLMKEVDRGQLNRMSSTPWKGRAPVPKWKRYSTRKIWYRHGARSEKGNGYKSRSFLARLILPQW